MSKKQIYLMIIGVCVVMQMECDGRFLGGLMQFANSICKLPKNIGGWHD